MYPEILVESVPSCMAVSCLNNQMKFIVYWF